MRPSEPSLPTRSNLIALSAKEKDAIISSLKNQQSCYTNGATTAEILLRDLIKSLFN
jgi:hypothetical protein